MGSGSGFAGTPAYAAPEVVGGMSAGSAAADAWSAGCVLQELCTLAKAFQSSNLASLFRAIVHNQRTPMRPSRYSEDLLAIIEGLLVPDPDARLSARHALANLPNDATAESVTRKLFKVPSSGEMLRDIGAIELYEATEAVQVVDRSGSHANAVDIDITSTGEPEPRASSTAHNVWPDWGAAVLQAL